MRWAHSSYGSYRGFWTLEKKPATPTATMTRVTRVGHNGIESVLGESGPLRPHVVLYDVVLAVPRIPWPSPFGSQQKLHDI